MPALPPPRPPSTASRKHELRRLPQALCSGLAELPALPSSERLEDQGGRPVDVARAERQDTVAGPRPAREEANALFDRRRPTELHAGTGLGQGVDDQLACHTLDRLLACAIDVRNGNDVRRRKRSGELPREVACARVEVGLEESEDAAAVAGCGDVGRELPRMVRIAVDDVDAADLSAQLEPAGRPPKLSPYAGGLPPRVGRQLGRAHGGRTALQVLVARDRGTGP